MAEPKVGQIYRVVKRPATKGDFYWYDGKWACSNYTHSGASPILEPIDPALVTIAPKPERFTVTGFGGVECDGRVLFTCVDTLNALDACKSLNALDRAAKEATDVKA